MSLDEAGTSIEPMNMNQIINMVIRRIMSIAINKDISAGSDKMAQRKARKLDDPNYDSTQNSHTSLTFKPRSAATTSSSGCGLSALQFFHDRATCLGCHLGPLRNFVDGTIAPCAQARFRMHDANLNARAV